VAALPRSLPLFALEHTGVIAHLGRFLRQYGVKQVQSKAYALEFRAGTREGQAYAEDMEHVYRTIRPFLEKWGCSSKDYQAIYQQLLSEMQQSGFSSTWELLTAWGKKPR